jgi:uncharacterized protein
MLEPGKLEKAFAKVEEENWMFRSFLKGQNEGKIDKLVHQMHQELFQQIDCLACSNCCKVISPALNKKEINEISGRLSMNADEFSKKYLQKDEEGDMLIRSKPCPFLTEKGCSIHDIKPKTCREYPYTNKAEIISRLINLVGNCEVCPVVFEIVERLKDIFRDDFEEYQEEMADLLG